MRLALLSEERADEAARQQLEVSQRVHQARQEASQPERQARPGQQVVWMRVLHQRLAFLAQTAHSVNSRTAASLPGRWP